jgi:hypothetical protein
MGCTSVSHSAPSRQPSDLTPYSGTYTFNFTDTDEHARVEIQFRKNQEPYQSVDWLADGSIRDGIRNRTITFTGAFVSVGENNEITVDAQFVRFKIKGNRLDWLPGYDHELFKE